MSKIKNHIIRHGELIMKAIGAIPEGAVLVETTNRKILAWSESHHHHVLKAIDLSKFKVYTWNGETYIEVLEMATLLHEKTGKDTHTPHKIIPNIYKVVIKKEYDYFLKAIRNVRD